MSLSDQHLVINLMDDKRDVVSGLLCLFTRGLHFGRRNLIGLSYLEQRRQWLRNLCSARCQTSAALVKDGTSRRNRRPLHCSKTAWADLNQLCVRDPSKAAVIAYG